MKKLIIGGFVAAMSIASPAAMATNDGSGCGLGGMVLKGKQGTGWNVLAAILNGIYGNQTFAMTSGTSDCDTTQVVQRDQMREIFVAQTFDTLTQEAAQGAGSHLEVLASLSGVQAGDMDAFNAMMQAQHSQLFSADSSVEMLQALDVALQSSTSFNG